MDLNDPGTSLFQGNDLHNFDNLAQREEEEEAIEEQKRRDLELKNMLENAFDDVSFDNDDGSVCNGDQNHSSSGLYAFQNKAHFELDSNVIKQVPQNKPDLEKNFLDSHNENFNTSLKHSRNNHIKRVDLSNTSENCSDQCRKKIQNGSLQDIVDASGGGDDVQSLLHYKHCFQRSSLGQVICNGISNSNNDKIVKTECTENDHDSTEQIKILYEVRVREVHKLTELIDSMKNKHEVEMKELKHQLALLLAEKERANFSQSQMQSLLISSKEQVEELMNDIKIVKKANEELETSKKELVIELDTAKLTIDDLQRKLLAVEKGSRNKSETMQYEINLKSLTEKHSVETMNLKKELDNYIKSCELLNKENEELKLKISNLSHINDENLAKKSEIISRLSKQVNETQKQCEHLMKSSIVEDNFRLQAELKMLKEEKMLLALKLDNLEKENSKQEEELKQYESINKISLFSGSLSDSKELEGVDINGKLGAELYRALNGQKTKRQEIKNLQAEINDKNEKILSITENEKILQTKITNLEEEINKSLSVIKENENLLLLKEKEIQSLHRLIEDLKKENSEGSVQNKCDELKKENELLKQKINNLEKEKIETISNYNEEYMRFHNEGLEKVKEETEKYFKLEILKKDLEIEKLKKEIEEVKNFYIEVYNEKENLLAQLEKEKDCSGRNCVVDMEEVKRLQKELEKSRHRILELDQTLKQQYQQEVEILNLDINQLNLKIEKIKKEKDRESAEKDKISVEIELLKSEIEHAISEKNLLFLNCEKLQKEVDELREKIQIVKENSKDELNERIEKHKLELQNLRSKYENTIKKLKKELELTLIAVKNESNHTFPIKGESKKNSVQNLVSADKSTSPIRIISTQESSTSPMPDLKRSFRKAEVKESLTLRNISILTDPEPAKIPKKEVIEIMEKLGAHHEEEVKILENRYRMELVKLEKKFQTEIDKAKEIIRRELEKEHVFEIEKMEEKHRIELENRIEQEKKEAVVDLITEWACEVQSLKASYAETQSEMERMKMKYKAAKSVALQYKTYFKSKAEHMKEEWKRIEDGYERALKELEKNVHILVDVKEDEVKAKVDSITKIYEQKINKMKEKLSKCEEKLKFERENRSKKKGESSKSQEKYKLEKELEKLSVPEGILCRKTCSFKLKDGSKPFSDLQYGRLNDSAIEIKKSSCKEERDENSENLGAQKRKHLEERITTKDNLSDKERTSR